MEINIKLHTDGEAFQKEPQHEVGRVLHEIASVIEHQGMPNDSAIWDANGDQCGFLGVRDGEGRLEECTEAVQRANQMMAIPFVELPELAVRFFFLMTDGRKVAPPEIGTKAFCVYAQVVEGLPCDDLTRLAVEDDVEWFRANGSVIAGGGT